MANDLDVRLNYFAGEQIPTGLNRVVEPFTGGAGNLDVFSAIDLLAYHFHIQSPHCWQMDELRFWMARLSEIAKHTNR